ncbi:hypothetical protein I6Y99_003228 [Vibrio parahaemolyticus]|uniref:hypothetical protein n=1 Tax=Vibrio parahaemolyticus TaxID=670 RepID=UPI0003AAE366|nr:hypothetical protein [Vibrio parahaemolyticus]EGQ7791912.1 hypothetical protein [Vibrio parahaemolyticus]EGQ7809249.1 hypothetical protein [Vibrio parahaemolyticus]EHJ9961284.1 hypothetical protein [Vibrio parahaemolyticus]EJU9123892.1 hypothetical protein [Vibrio parahaemolyticus]ELA7027621.1 hypothetical protein [Vibrio parahaemolyticus]
MKRLVFIFAITVLSGCTSYHIEQNARNGMTSCAEQGSSGNLILKKSCEINASKEDKQSNKK